MVPIWFQEKNAEKMREKIMYLGTATIKVLYL